MHYSKCGAKLLQLFDIAKLFPVFLPFRAEKAIYTQALRPAATHESRYWPERTIVSDQSLFLLLFVATVMDGSLGSLLGIEGFGDDVGDAEDTCIYNFPYF